MKTSSKIKTLLIIFFIAIFTIITARHFIGLHFKKKFSVRPAPGVIVSTVEKSLFSGKEYKISANIDGDIWVFFNDFSLEKNQKIYLDFNNEDLLEFDSTCSNFFTQNNELN